MRPKFGTWCLVVLALLALSSAVSAQPLPPVVEFTIVDGPLFNIEDDAGLWQHEGGLVYYKGEQIGRYAVHRRVTNAGTSALNAAMVTMTIFFAVELDNSTVPQSITLQGSHQFQSGLYVGSVSAASEEYLQFIGKRFFGDENTNTLRIGP